MTPRELESRVRRRLDTLVRGRLWQKAASILDAFAKDFGKECVTEYSDSCSAEQSISIYTGFGWITIAKTSSRYGLPSLSIHDGHETVLYCKLIHDHTAKSQSHFTAQSAIVKCGALGMLEVFSYKPGQWERVLDFKEAKRLLAQAEEAKAAVERKKMEEEKKRQLTEGEKKLASNFGINT